MALMISFVDISVLSPALTIAMVLILSLPLSHTSVKHNLFASGQKTALSLGPSIFLIGLGKSLKSKSSSFAFIIKSETNLFDVKPTSFPLLEIYSSLTLPFCVS